MKKKNDKPTLQTTLRNCRVVSGRFPGWCFQKYLILSNIFLTFNQMKKLLPLLLLILIGCSEPEPINVDTMLIQRNGVYYTKDTNKPYSGPTYEINTVRKIRHEGNMKNGKYHGKQEFYYTRSGRLFMKGSYKNGLFHGYSESYYENGSREYEGNFKNGEYHGLFKSYYDNMTLNEEGNFKNGREDGLWKTYNRNGKLENESTYEDGYLINSKDY